jgi:hypothetical protein
MVYIGRLPASPTPQIDIRTTIARPPSTNYYYYSSELLEESCTCDCRDCVLFVFQTPHLATPTSGKILQPSCDDWKASMKSIN